MTTLLQINASMFAAAGQSTQLADAFVATWRDSHPGARVIVRDLAREAVPHLTAERFGAFVAKAEERTADQDAVVRFSDTLIDELRRADVIVLGLPLYNFGVPSPLKAYFDHVARAGVTFSYTAKGPVGLLTGKQAYVFAARGGVYAGTPLDTQTSYVRDFLRFIGIGQVTFVHAEGLNLGAEKKDAALREARAAISRLVAPAVAEPLAA
jgi:FMN-dependent NADH-azoreductase